MQVIGVGPQVIVVGAQLNGAGAQVIVGSQITVGGA